MTAYDKDLDSLLTELSTDSVSGLSEAQAGKSLEKFGKNVLREKKKKTIFQRFIEQFKDVMILILIAAAVISFITAFYEGNVKDFLEPCLILAIVIVNAIIGVIQESKAEKALEALKNLSAPHARVIRDGDEKIIDAADLVPGDIIHLEAGDFVPADSRILRSMSLKSEESALTGESVPAEKEANAIIKENAPLGDRANMVFSGCSITYGTASAVVTATGMDTEMGKIANLLENEADTMTPLQKKLADLGKYLGIVALAACAIIFIVGIIDGLPVMEMFMTAVSLAVSAIPEGLPAIVTIVLSIGVQRMAKQNAIIKSLPAVETLGSASIICSDKTGTLTQNRMTLVKAYVDGDENLEDISESNSSRVKELLKYGTLCSDGTVILKNNEEQHIGDPTETSIVLAAYKNGMTKDALNKEFPRIAEIPFDSDRKLMTTINKINGKNIAIVKGAFDVISQKCIAGNLEKAKELTETMSSEALRVLAIAYKEIDCVPDNLTSDDIENNLIFMGLVGMIDPPRLEAKEAVAVCKKAGIKPIMITGDHVVTASAIAKQLGILGENDEAITGATLDNMTDSELDKRVNILQSMQEFHRKIRLES